MDAPLLARFTILAVADPQTVPRLINYFAQLALVPSGIAVRADTDRLAVVIEQYGLEPHQARIIAEKMRTSVLVLGVSLAFESEIAAIPVAA